MSDLEHGFNMLVGSNDHPRTYYARCLCGWKSAPSTKDDAYDAFADHYMAQPEVLAHLAEVRATGLLAKAQQHATSTPLRIEQDEVLPMRVVRPPDPEPDQFAGAEVAWVVGTHPSCDWVVNDPYVSHRHCAIYRDSSGHYSVEDLGSTNGTFIRRQAPHGPADIHIHRRTAILHGDQVIIGRTVLGDPPPPPGRQS